MKAYGALLTGLICIMTNAAIAQKDPYSTPPPVSTTKSPPLAATKPDGLVTGLNVKSYAALKTIKTRNPGAFTDADAKELKAAVMAEGGLDPIEHDLLDELVQSSFRRIVVTPEKATAGEQLVSYPVSGFAKQTLINTLVPPIDFEVEWAKGQTGWQAMAAEYKKSTVTEAQVINFVHGKLAPFWEQSNMGNGYKPLRNEIGRLYGYSNVMPDGDVNVGRTMLYRSMNQLDRASKDAVPDFLYNWVRPGGYL
jgi:hypothetical protein